MPYVVLKFGGSSVSSLPSWRTIEAVVRARIAQGLRPVVVCSALSEVSDLLDALATEAAAGRHAPLLRDLEDRHAAHAEALGVDLEGARPDLQALERLALGASLLGESSPRVKARLMARGELLSTRLGTAFLRDRGLDCGWLDARDLLIANPEPGVRGILSAHCTHTLDPALVAELDALPHAVLVTQGFIARDPEGRTVLLGRGGSDTSAAVLAGRLGAARCELWSDVPGLYTADPRGIPTARLLRTLDYDEAQELASTGAKALHPRAIPPLRAGNIPLELHSTRRPEAEGTLVAASESAGTGVKAIATRRGQMLVSMETVGMWQQVGFLANVFACFQRRGLSVDLVSTSELNVTVSLDPAANDLDSQLEGLLDELGEHCRARPIGPCAAVSLVGRNIRSVLHRLGPALELFEEHRIHLVCQAASDLNLTFVVDEDQADRLVSRLHGLLFSDEDESLGPAWEETFEARQTPAPSARWWLARAEELCSLATQRGPLYVYDEASLDGAAIRLLGLSSVRQVLYAVKANPHPGVLDRFYRAGLGFETVSPGELRLVLERFPQLDRQKVLFTPNFAPREDYAFGLEAGVNVTLDNLHPLEQWGDLFAGRAIFVRIDPGRGRGHHHHVRTVGTRSKFGVSADQLPRLAELAKEHGVTVIGLHAHAGSGVLDPEGWRDTAMALLHARSLFPEVRVLDLGGGLGVPETGGAPLDLAALDDSLAEVCGAYPDLDLWIEPGRYLVAEAGVLLAPVTQLKDKGPVRYVGIGTGMNSLIRPALYGAAHPIVNLSRQGQPGTRRVQVVGPICESGDTLGWDRRLPDTVEGDVLLIDVAGAYGHAMSSRYNLREPAAEIVLPPVAG